MSEQMATIGGTRDRIFWRFGILLSLTGSLLTSTKVRGVERTPTDAGVRCTYRATVMRPTMVSPVGFARQTSGVHC